ncbi:hypothetical protein Plhal703r1_c13g0067401 [Plasmopara halstedii]
MKIAELLNEPTSTTQHHRVKRMDMLSLDLLTRKRKYRSDLSMNKTGDFGTLSQLIARKVEETRSNNPVVKECCRNTLLYHNLPPVKLEKRIKQRMLVRRSYHRKIDTLMKLQNEMKSLESKCRDVIVLRQRISQSFEPFESEKQRCEQLRKQYSQLSITQEKLRHENKQLRLKSMELSKARTRIRILLNEELQEEKEARVKGKLLGLSMSCHTQPYVRTSLSIPVPAMKKVKRKFKLKFTPITVDECLTIVREAYTDVRAFTDKQRYETTGTTVFGWRDRHEVNGEKLRFFLEKTFRHVTASEICKRMWDLVSSEQDLNRIYASDVAIRFHLVQRVNDENVLYYRTIEPIGGNVVLKRSY